MKINPLPGIRFLPNLLRGCQYDLIYRISSYLKISRFRR